MDKTYNPVTIEARWAETWEQSGAFKPRGEGKPYCIMIPPPNVTGSLHMGHGFQDTLMDTLIRYHRMQGDNTLWQVGTDHAGIATQMVVERGLQRDEQKTRHDLGRDAFVDRIWQWKKQSGGNISKQLRRLGASVDWDRERFTMDEGLSKAVMTVFIELYDQGLIYRGKRLVNWDPVLLTAVSDLEVEAEETEGHLWHIRYPIVGQDGHLVVATTRPETLLGDVAVAVHPDDERYQHLIGKKCQLPLTSREIPIIADDYVDPDFGSGCVKITPAHDFNDYQIGKRHDLPLINILTPTAALNDNVPSQYQGLDRFDARKQVLKDLESSDLLGKVASHLLKVPKGDRTGAVLEPYLTDQWFVKAGPLAEPALAAVKEGKIRIVPETWEKTYYQWLENIEDWCISRQLWWGHRIPAWYDNDGNVYVADSEQAVREKYKLAADHPLRQEEDVLDTWFSSALWPFSTLGWPEQTEDLATFYPTQVLVSGFDILFFWIARMVMLGLKFTDQIPFHEVYITGLIRDHEGHKMSKSKGNVLDPIDLIDGIDLESLVKKRLSGLMQPEKAKQIEKATRTQFPHGIAPSGTDALRFTYCALASTGRDIRFDLSRLEGYRNFCNKMWNAARYVLMNTEQQAENDRTLSPEFSVADEWIRSRLQHTISKARNHLDNYRFDLFAQTAYDFLWNEYCDWYLELSKPILTGKTNPNLQAGTRLTLLTVLETTLRLLHPVMPFITEEIWQRCKTPLALEGDTLMWQAYPEANPQQINDQAEANITWLQQVIIAVRTIRAEMNIAPGKPLKLILTKGNEQDKQRSEALATYLIPLARLESLTWQTETTSSSQSATALVDDLELQVPLAGLIDREAERARLQKEIDKLQATLTRSQNKLNNENFTAKAPAAVVAKEKEIVESNQKAINKLTVQLSRVM